MRILYPFLIFTGPTNMRVLFYLKSLWGKLFFSNRTIIIFAIFFHSKSDERLIKNTCYIYLHFSSRIYIFIYGTYLGPLYQ